MQFTQIFFSHPLFIKTALKEDKWQIYRIKLSLNRALDGSCLIYKRLNFVIYSI